MMTPQEKADLDSHITREPEQSYDYSQAPILAAWSMLDKSVCPMPDKMIARVTEYLAKDDPEAAIAQLRLYYEESDDADAEQSEACNLFSRGWEVGVENLTFGFDDFDEDGWEVRAYSYLLGFCSGRFAYTNEDETPYGPADD